MEIKTVALLGAGGIGSYFVWGLSEALGQDFCVVAEGGRARRLRQEGIVINGKPFPLNVKTPEEAAGCDLLVVAVKYYSLEDALDTIRTVAGPNTVVLSLLNGIDSEEMIGGAIGREHVVWSMIRFSVQREGNTVSFDPDAAEGLLFGERDTGEKTERILALERLFARGRVKARAVPDIAAAQWQKLMLNISGNLPQAVLGVGYGAYFDSEHVAAIRIRLQQEVQATAAAMGISLQLPDPNKAVFGKAVRFSTLQDLDAKRRTEVDMFLKVLIQKAEEHGLSVPYAEYTYHAIKALEEKNQGKFDYGQ